MLVHARPGSGILLNLDPRTKLLALVCVALLLIAGNSVLCLAGATLMVAAGVILSDVTARDLRRRLGSIVWFGTVIVVVQACTTGGSVIAEFVGVYLTREGVAAGLVLVFRLGLLAAAALAFVRSTPVPDLVDTIDAATARLGTSMRGTAMALHIALMFGPMLVDRARQLTRAFTARGTPVDTGILARVRFAAAAAIPFFVTAFRSADQLGIAMQIRAYDPRRRRTPFRIPEAGRLDIIIAGLVIVVTAALLVWPVRGS